MFRCVKCGHTGYVFRVCSGECVNGAYTFQAVCPSCGSHMVDVLAGTDENQMSIGTIGKAPAMTAVSIRERVTGPGCQN